jgi:hypothetical protein
MCDINWAYIGTRANILVSGTLHKLVPEVWAAPVMLVSHPDRFRSPRCSSSVSWARTPCVFGTCLPRLTEETCSVLQTGFTQEAAAYR